MSSNQIIFTLVLFMTFDFVSTLFILDLIAMSV